MTKEQLSKENAALRDQVTALQEEITGLRAEAVRLQSQLNGIVPEDLPAYQAMQKAVEQWKLIADTERSHKEAAQAQAAQFRKLYQATQAAEPLPSSGGFRQAGQGLPAKEDIMRHSGADDLPEEKTGRPGRPVTVTQATADQAAKMRDDGYSIRKIAAALHISVGSVARILERGQCSKNRSENNLCQCSKNRSKIDLKREFGKLLDDIDDDDAAMFVQGIQAALTGAGKEG